MPDLWSDLLACLDLHPVPSGGTGEADSGDDVTGFEGRNQRLEYHRVFGGQLLGQFIRIASATCPGKAVKSQHAVFAREGRADEPIRYQAIRHHEGRSFATVTITARQSRGVVATSSICMHTPEDGPERQTVDAMPVLLGPDHQVTLDLIPWETRTAVDLNATTTGPPQCEVWMRTPAVDQERAPGLAAYATDLTLIGNRAAANGRCGPTWQRHGVHLRRHVPHHLVSPTLPYRRLAAAAPAQPTAGARSQLRPR